LSRPVVSRSAEELYRAIAPAAFDDEVAGWPLLKYCDAWTRAEAAHDPVFRFAEDGTPNWAVLFTAQCPDAWLPWVSQFVGVELTLGATPEQQRAAIAAKTNWGRGTPAGLRSALQTKLTGAKTVIIYERFDQPVSADAAYQIGIRVRTSEATLTLADFTTLAKRYIPAGVKLDFQFVAGFTWDEITAQARTWDQIAAVPRTWTSLETQGAI
jgi:Phage tail protein (Tail_P2_I)